MPRDKKTPAKKPVQRRKKKQPAAMSGIQKDALDSVRDQNLTSVSQSLKDGKIDHGPAASPTRGVLDPEEFDKFEIDVRPSLNETQRISKVICEHLNKNYSKGGKYEWTCGFFTPEDPRANGTDGFQALTPHMVGDAWSTQLQHEVGLTIFNGALCWNGRGTFERHVICVKTKQLQTRQLLANEEAMQAQFKQPETVGDARVSRLQVKETTKKLPLVPARKQDGNSNHGDTLTTD